MPPTPLLLTLAEDGPHGRYLLSSPVANYAVELRTGPETELGDLLRRLPDALVGLRGTPVELDPAVLRRQAGTALWRALLPAGAAAEERERLAAALRAGGAPLLLRLPSGLAVLPWELLCDPDAAGEGGFVARRRPVARLAGAGESLEPLDAPLRVLLLISSPPGLPEQRRVDVESERAAVEDAVRDFRAAGLLHLLVEDIVSLTRVQQHLLRFRPHILHYIGHGAYFPNMGGFLEWEKDNGETLLLSGRELGEMLQPRGLRAVLLHGCETAESDSRSEFKGVAEALLASGIPAVLAQQASFTYESSKRAAEMFYTAVTSGLGLAEATFEARLALAQHGRPDWAVPVLQASEAALAPLLNDTAAAGDPDPRLEPALTMAELPAPTGPFVGRHAELRALRLMLEEAQGRGAVMALVTGPGGVGKSTLVAQAVVRYAKGYQAALTLRCNGYQGMGILLKEIGEFLYSQGAPAFLQQVLPEAALSIQGKIKAAVEALTQAGPFLLVVDNLESAQDEQRRIEDPDLLFFLQALIMGLRRGRVLVTGRYAVSDLLPQAKFQGSVLRLDLDDLSQYEVYQLLGRHSSLARLGEAVQRELVRQFGGLPYVYDLLASKAASHDLQGLIQDMQGRVTEERQRRSEQEWAEVRREVVEFAALETTVARLPEEARELLLRLSVFRRPFPQTALEEGLGAQPPEWQPLLDWSLLRYDQQGKEYRLHSLTAHHARNLLDGEERKQTQVRLAEWYLEHLGESHALVDALEAHALFLDSGESVRAGELVMALAETLDRLGLYELWGDLARTTAATTEGLTAAAATHHLGVIAQAQGQYDEARRLYYKAVDLYTDLSDEGNRAGALHQLGNIAQAQGQYDEARRLYSESLAITERLADQRGWAGTLHQLGIIAQAQGQYDEARRLYSESLAINERLGDQRGWANTLHQLGNIAQAQGQYDEARRLYGEVLEVFERLGDQRGRAITLHHLGIIAQDQGQYDEARRLYGESLAIEERLGNQRGWASTLLQLGTIAQAQGQYDEARRLYGESLAIAERLSDQSGRAGTLHQLGNIAYAQGQYDEASGLYGEVLEVFERLGDQSGRAITLHQLGMIARSGGDHRAALHYALQAIDLFRRLGSPHLRTALDALSRLRRELGEERFTDLWREVAGAAPVPDLQSADPEQELVQRLIAFIHAKTWGESRRMLEQQPELLSEEADQALLKLAAVQKNEGARRTIELHLRLLARCRKIGVDAAFDEMLAELRRRDQEQQQAAGQLAQFMENVRQALTAGSVDQRAELASKLEQERASVPAESEAWSEFLGVLAAALRGETPEASGLEEPFASLWASLRDRQGAEPPESSS